MDPTGESTQRTAKEHGKHTGWAIGLALAATAFFYIVYRLLFGFVISAYASYDPSFASGLGALAFMGFGSNVLAFLSGVVVSRRVFPRASIIGLFYGLATLLVVVTALAVLVELGRSDGHWIVALINIAISATTILAIRLLLFSSQ
jgi:hypothetical protein